MAMKVTFPKQKLKNVVETLKDYPRAFGRDDAKAMAEEVLDEMQSLIAKGISPVRGEGRFTGYSESYPSKWHQRTYGKKKRPVNLRLSGDMLSNLTYKIVKVGSRSAVEIFFKSAKSSGQKLSPEEKFQKNQKTRPLLPTSGKGFALSIQEIVVRHYNEAINAFLKKMLG